jgi:quercetin dioxygenase-like cupin family protein
MKKIPFKPTLALVLCLCGVSLLAVTAYALTVENLAHGTIAFLDRFNGPAEVFIDKATLEPSDVAPYHFHPGDATVVVTQGTLTLTTGCGDVQQYSAGQAFVEPAGVVHQVSNEGSETVIFYGVIVAPAGSEPVTFVGGPSCSPTSVEQCKNGAWANFSTPRSFKNQGDCVSSVKSGK